MNTVGKILSIAMVVTSSISIIGCSKGAGGGAGTEGTIGTLCNDAAAKVGEDLKIEGPAKTNASEPASYMLNQDLGCTTGSKVEWKTLSSTAPEAKGEEFTPNFKSSGEYVIQANVDGNVAIQKTTVVGTQAVIVGPEIGMAGVQLTFDLGLPVGFDAVSAVWNFGAGKAPVNSLGPVNVTYSNIGNFMVSVAITNTAGTVTTIQRPLQVLYPIDGLECVVDMTVSGPAQVNRNEPNGWAAYLPPCLNGQIHRVTWTFSDGTPSTLGTSVTHAFANLGAYTLSIHLYTDSGNVPWMILTRQINVVEPEVVDPLLCPNIGDTRDSYEESFEETVSCGINGSRTNTYRTHIVETCQRAEMQRWMETSRTKELLEEGECTGQACEIPTAGITSSDALAFGFIIKDGKYYLAHGASHVFYSSQTPAGQCDSVKTTRSCSNGQLSGSEEYQHYTCHNGCEGFGEHGTVKVGINVGQETVAKECSFGETGITDIYTQLNDQTCTDGTVKTSNTRRGGLVTAGVCPTYNWSPTENYSACSADCGGEQNLIYDCRDDKGQPAALERCTGEPAVVSRVCDGNPEAVRRTESTTSEEAGSSNACPKNQVGVITKVRDVTITKTYACIDHQVSQESETASYGEWIEEKYCRDYVATRCNQDSLSNADAHGRYDWMVKCADQVPIIKKFLEEFDDIKVHGGAINISDSKRVLYPTFMNTKTKPEKPWIAPKNKNGSCVVPETVYIAAVCLSSCATPEQQILTGTERGSKVQYTSFLEAVTNKHPYVASLRSESNMQSRTLAKTKVDQWVSEMMDTEHDIVELKMASGGALRLTPNHPVVSPEGMMVLVSDLKVGDSLVQLGGRTDRIVSLTHVKHFGKVYNVFVRSADPMKNVVVTGGYLNGTAFYQNEGAKFMNRRVFQGKLTKGVFSK